MRSLYQFKNYRQYLQAFLEDQKGTQPSFNLSKFAKKIGLGSGHHLSLIISGERNLTVKSCLGAARAMHLNLRETRFFETLMHYNHTDNDLDKSYYEQCLNELRSGRKEDRSKDFSSGIFSEWFHPAALLCIEGVGDEKALKRLEDRLNLPAEAGKTLIEKFVNLDVLVKPNKTYKMIADYVVYEDPTGMKKVHREYTEMQLARSKKALQDQYDTTAKFFSHTFSIEADQLPFVTGMIDDFLQVLTEHSNKQKNERLAQINIQFFPIEKNPSSN